MKFKEDSLFGERTIYVINDCKENKKILEMQFAKKKSRKLSIIFELRKYKLLLY